MDVPPTQLFWNFVVFFVTYVFSFRFNVAVAAAKSLRTNVTFQGTPTTPSVTPVTILWLAAHNAS